MSDELETVAKGEGTGDEFNYDDLETEGPGDNEAPEREAIFDADSGDPDDSVFNYDDEPEIAEEGTGDNVPRSSFNEPEIAEEGTGDEFNYEGPEVETGASQGTGDEFNYEGPEVETGASQGTGDEFNFSYQEPEDSFNFSYEEPEEVGNKQPYTSSSSFQSTNDNSRGNNTRYSLQQEEVVYSSSGFAYGVPYRPRVVSTTNRVQLTPSSFQSSSQYPTQSSSQSFNQGSSSSQYPTQSSSQSFNQSAFQNMDPSFNQRSSRNPPPQQRGFSSNI